MSLVKLQTRARHRPSAEQYITSLTTGTCGLQYPAAGKLNFVVAIGIVSHDFGLFHSYCKRLSGCFFIFKDPSIFKGLGPELRAKFCSPSPAMVTSPYERKFLSGRKTMNNQSINQPLIICNKI
jgi:hypothetical protein